MRSDDPAFCMNQILEAADRIIAKTWSTDEFEVLAIAKVHHQPATAHGAVVLYRVGHQYSADFLNMDAGGVSDGYLQSSGYDGESPEDASDSFRALCGKYWVGMPMDTRPARRLTVQAETEKWAT